MAQFNMLEGVPGLPNTLKKIFEKYTNYRPPGYIEGEVVSPKQLEKPGVKLLNPTAYGTLGDALNPATRPALVERGRANEAAMAVGGGAPAAPAVAKVDPNAEYKRLREQALRLDTPEAYAALDNYGKAMSAAYNPTLAITQQNFPGMDEEALIANMDQAYNTAEGYLFGTTPDPEAVQDLEDQATLQPGAEEVGEEVSKDVDKADRLLNILKSRKDNPEAFKFQG